MHKKNILIYGATGSIGDSTLSLIRNNKELFNIVGLTCNSNIQKLIDISKEFNCENLGVNDESSIQNYPEINNFNIHIGLKNFSNLLNENVDIIVFAISGSAPLNLLMEIADCGKIIGLANKECIICLGKIFLNAATKSSTKIIPLDSEHNAIFQLINNKKKKYIRKFTLTASGGHFYNYSKFDFKKITVDQATSHPKWKMGKKISVDSSTLMNKGLEIIEACLLFDIKPNNIDAIIHPESIIHGIIEFNDRSSHAFMSQPNMEISISSVLFDNNSVNLNKYNLDLTKINSLNFYEIDNKKFNAIELAKFSMNEGGLIPGILNYANELMVDLFLRKKILFSDITKFNEILINKFISEGNNIQKPTIDDIASSFEIIDTYIPSIRTIID